MAQETEHSWDRQPGESTTEYRAFCAFRDLPYQDPPRRRSRAGAAAFMGKNNRPLFNKYAAKWNWEERARDYDNELQHIEFDERKKQIKAMLENKIKVARALQTKGIKALAELPQDVLSARNVLDYLVQGVQMENEALMELVNGLGAVTGAKGKGGGIMAEIAEPEESTMMQLVKSLEAARRKKEQ